MVSAREIQAVAELLQVSPEGLQKAITFKVTVSLRALHPDKGLFLQGHSAPFPHLIGHLPVKSGEVEPHFRPLWGLFSALITLFSYSCWCGWSVCI